MQINCLSFDSGKSASGFDLTEALIDQPFKETLVHQFVVTYQSNARLGTKAQKSRAQVKSGGRKPWKQKGTGRARAGCKTGPIWRGGGVTFAANGEQSFKKKLNRKAHRAAMASILSELLRQERLVVLDEVVLSEPKTKLMVSKLAGLNMAQKRVYLVTDHIDPNVLMASSNLHDVMYTQVRELSPVALIHCDCVLITKAALQWLEATYK